jgi:pilus assembly protein Flp/PilA
MELKNADRNQMNAMFLGLYVKFESLVSREEGQDLVEYALLVALIALGAVASMKGMAHAVSTEFSVIESTFSSAV